ncbi:MAG: hypothetical protein ACRDRU_00615 [Pseudonocardiaceae bacterium]
MPPPRTGQPQGPEQAAHHDGAGVLVPPGPPTLRAGHLGSQGSLGLLLDQHTLNSGQQLQSLTPLKTQRVEGQGVPIQGQHLADHARGVRVVASLDNDLHGDLHSAPASTTRS